jgi:hypothetical protein
MHAQAQEARLANLMIADWFPFLEKDATLPLLLRFIARPGLIAMGANASAAPHFL